MSSFSAVQKQFIRAGQGFLLAYSIDSRDSFEEVNAFHHLIRSVKANENFPIVLTACKCDLEKDRQVGTNGESSLSVFILLLSLNILAEGRDLAKHLGCMFFESSAKRSIQVEEAFTNLVREIRRFKKVGLFVCAEVPVDFDHAYLGKTLDASTTGAPKLDPVRRIPERMVLFNLKHAVHASVYMQHDEGNKPFNQRYR